MSLADNTYQEIEKFKESIIDTTLLIGAVIGFLAYAIAVFPLTFENQSINFYTDFLSFVVLFSVYGFRKKISVKTKALVILALLLGFVITSTLEWGVYSFNKVLLVIIPFYALLVFKFNKAILFYTISIFCYLGIGFLFVNQYLTYDTPHVERIYHWNAWLVSAIIITTATAIILVFTKKYNQALDGLIKALEQNNSDLKFREKHLQIEQTFTNHLIDSLPGIFNLYKKTDNGYELVNWNKNTELVSGLSDSQLLGQNPLFIIDPAHRDIIAGVVDNIDQGKVDSGTAKSWNLADNSKNKWYYFTGHPTTIDGEQYFIGIGVDISDQKNAEYRFEEARKLSTRILDIFPGMFYMYEKVNEEFSLVQWNKNTEIETGYSATELRGASPLFFFSEEHLPSVVAAIKAATKTGFVAIEAPIIKKTGTSDYWYFVNQIYKEGKKEFLIGFAIDISQRKVIERELEHKSLNLKDMLDDMMLRNRKLAEYAFINSHLLRAPLARILGLAELVSKEVILSEHGELLENFITSAKELDAIVSTINEVLDHRKDLNRNDIIAALNKSTTAVKTEKS